VTRNEQLIDRVATAVALAAVVAVGLSAGAMLAEAAVLVPYWRSLEAAAFLAWYAANAARLFDFFAPLEIAGAGLGVVAAGLYGFRRRSGAVLLALSALLAVGVLVPFPLYFRDVNASFEAATIEHGQVAAELARWAWWHWLRTALGTGAFVTGLLAVWAGRD